MSLIGWCARWLFWWWFWLILLLRMLIGGDWRHTLCSAKGRAWGSVGRWWRRLRRRRRRQRWKEVAAKCSGKFNGQRIDDERPLCHKSVVPIVLSPFPSSVSASSSKHYIVVAVLQRSKSDYRIYFTCNYTLIMWSSHLIAICDVCQWRALARSCPVVYVRPHIIQICRVFTHNVPFIDL